MVRLGPVERVSSCRARATPLIEDICNQRICYKLCSTSSQGGARCGPWNSGALTFLTIVAVMVAASLLVLRVTGDGVHRDRVYPVHREKIEVKLALRPHRR